MHLIHASYDGHSKSFVRPGEFLNPIILKQTKPEKQASALTMNKLSQNVNKYFKFSK